MYVSAYLLAGLGCAKRAYNGYLGNSKANIWH